MLAGIYFKATADKWDYLLLMLLVCEPEVLTWSWLWVLCRAGPRVYQPFTYPFSLSDSKEAWSFSVGEIRCHGWHFFNSNSAIPETTMTCQKHLKPCSVSLDLRQILSFWQTLETIMSFPQSKSQMELLGTGSLSPYHCFVKSVLILAVIITEQLNGLGNFQFRRIPENISLRFDLD